MSMLPRRFTTLRSAGTHRARVFHRYRPAHAGLLTLAGLIIRIDHLAIGLKTAIRVLREGSPLSAAPCHFSLYNSSSCGPRAECYPHVPCETMALSAKLWRWGPYRRAERDTQLLAVPKSSHGSKAARAGAGAGHLAQIHRISSWKHLGCSAGVAPHSVAL